MREGWWYSGDSINCKIEVIELDTKDQSSDILDCDGDMIKLFLKSFKSRVGRKKLESRKKPKNKTEEIMQLRGDQDSDL